VSTSSSAGGGVGNSGDEEEGSDATEREGDRVAEPSSYTVVVREKWTSFDIGLEVNGRLVIPAVV